MTPIPTPTTADAPPAAPLDAWRALSLDLPRLHADLAAGRPDAFAARAAALPDLPGADLDALAEPAARLAALDVLMIEAVARCRQVDLPPGAAETLARAVAGVARRCGIPPILSYPLYIRVNPTDMAEIRRFTPLAAEFRFIRMHRLIEDVFDRMIAGLGAVLGAPDRAAALAAAMPALRADFRLVNRTMAAFRSPARIDRHAFVDGFRPYFEPVLDPATGQTVLEGPSGLQSPTYRIIAMQIGYRDRVMDGWTTRIAACHDAATRAQLADAMAARDAGRSLTALCDAVLGPAPELPHLHPAYAADIPDLLRAALAGGYVSRDIMATFAHFALPLGEWPAEAPADGPPPPRMAAPPVDPAGRATLAHLAEIEAMLFGMHLEHAAVAAVQIGAVRGTGGTSGVEFLLVATFRRAFPRLWLSGAGAGEAPLTPR